jgi:hypothetical protein
VFLEQSEEVLEAERLLELRDSAVEHRHVPMRVTMITGTDATGLRFSDFTRR